MRKTWRIRAFIVGIGLFLLAASYLVFIPSFPPKEQAWVLAAVPVSFSVGVIFCIAGLLIERKRPHLFARITPSRLAVPSSLALGALIIISEGWLVVLGAAMAGVTLPIATPLARFPIPSGSERDTTRSGASTEDASDSR